MQINERPTCIFCFIKKYILIITILQKFLSMQNIEVTKVEKRLAVFSAHLIYIKTFLEQSIPVFNTCILNFSVKNFLNFFKSQFNIIKIIFLWKKCTEKINYIAGQKLLSKFFYVSWCNLKYIFCGNMHFNYIIWIIIHV